MAMFHRLALAIALCGSMSACSGVIPNSSAQSTPAPQESPWVQGVDTSAPTVNPPAATPIPATPVQPAIQGASIQPGSDPTQAIGRPLRQGPAIATLRIDAIKASAALAAFRTSCPSLVNREDQSGLTRRGDWTAACDAAKSWNGDAVAFFDRYLETVQVDTGAAFATGYFEPQILGSRTRQPGYDVPVYRRPPDLIDVDLGLFSEDMKGKRIRGRVQGSNFVQYADRAAIEDGALAGRGLEIAYAADPIEFFFLQIQGSGRLRLPDGSIMRIGYESQNGRDYLGIGAVMRERGLLAPGQASMQGIVDWLRRNPEEGRNLMRENKSYVFFREITGPGPLGAMGYPVIGQTSVAADPKFLPLGAPIFLSMDRAEPNGLWIAQDTGGAIKGPNRVDTFWGAGDQARAIAGGMSARGQALLFLPKGTYQRLAAQSGQ